VQAGPELLEPGLLEPEPPPGQALELELLPAQR
jgi:hypothetical protein